MCCLQKEYLALVEQCMDFACELMDLCRGTQEVQAVLGGEHMVSSRDPLARLRLAIHYGEKKVTRNFSKETGFFAGSRRYCDKRQIKQASNAVNSCNVTFSNANHP